MIKSKLTQKMLKNILLKRLANKNMGTPIHLFDYNLPDELIARYPSQKRDGCRLLALDKENGDITDAIFSDIAHMLDSTSFLVVNNTKVRNARLEAWKISGGKSQLFITEVLSPHTFKALVKGSFKDGDVLNLLEGSVTLSEKLEDGVWLAKSETDINQIMSRYGHIPLPPYINRNDEPSDKEDYQTVYAKNEGSAAAATAGLHFSKELLDKLSKKGLEIIEITLDVGIGTFRPVKTPTIEEHVMHSERYEITSTAACKINELKEAGKKLIAVGSTSVRALEAAACAKGKVKSGCGSTDILIYPPYNFMMVDGMITNFHLPKSTLLAMTAAFGGYENVMKAYAHAVSEGYRFFSYGDAMLVRAGRL